MGDKDFEAGEKAAYEDIYRHVNGKLALTGDDAAKLRNHLADVRSQTADAV